MREIAAVGHVTHDLYHHGLEAGGCAFYAARVYAALNSGADLITQVGDDFELSDALAGIDHTLATSGATTTFFNLERADAPRLQLVEGVGDSMPAQKLPHAFIHIAPVLNEIDLGAWVRANAHATIAINVQGWIKEPGRVVESVDPAWPDGLSASARVVEQVVWIPPAELAQVDIACMSEEDLIGQGDLFDIIRSTVRRGAVTRGEHGATVWDGAESWDVPAVPTNVVDATGAGDTFAASFCAAINKGADVESAGRYAAAAASVVCEQAGANALKTLRSRVGLPVARPLAT